MYISSENLSECNIMFFLNSLFSYVKYINTFFTISIHYYSHKYLKLLFIYMYNNYMYNNIKIN